MQVTLGLNILTGNEPPELKPNRNQRLQSSSQKIKLGTDNWLGSIQFLVLEPKSLVP